MYVHDLTSKIIIEKSAIDPMKPHFVNQQQILLLRSFGQFLAVKICNELLKFGSNLQHKKEITSVVVVCETDLF